MTRHYSHAVRYRAIGMFEAGMAVESICDRLDVPQATVYFWIRKFKKTGDVERRPGSGKSPATSNRADRCLVRLARSNRFASSTTLLSLWGKSVSPTTVRRRLRSHGFFSRRPKVHPLLSPVHRKTRFEWATKRCHFRETQWKKIIFTDESRFLLFPTDGRERVWRTSSERNQEELAVTTTNFGGGSVHVWGAIHADGRSELVILRSTVNGEVYKAVLSDHLLPWADTTLGSRQTHWLLQDDNAPAHRSTVVNCFKTAVGIRTIQWPARSPDLNPIENVWDILGRRIRKQNPRPSSLAQLASALKTEWESIPQSHIQHLILSMTRRVRAVIEAKGGPTRY